MSDIMSNSPDFSEAGTFSGRKSPEKSNFQQTCNLLSQYLKEKRSFGDLSLGMTSNLEVKGKPETLRPATMDLLGKIEKSGDASDRNAKSMDLFPQHGGFGPATEDARKSTDARPPTEPETFPLTIFYGGRVFVFNDFPAAKAKDIMLMANKGLFPNTGNGVASVSGIGVGNRPPQHDTALSAVSAAGNGTQQDRPPRTPQGDVIDLPIARKVSLHRFLEKRKERICAKAPYQSRKDFATPANPPQTESKSWLGLAPQTN